ncbi:MAG: sugar ABC transporter permease [Rhizobiales bacterium]|nr:sugar ABC transporter permease [Hyphomicrobiales bacterium]
MTTAAGNLQVSGARASGPARSAWAGLQGERWHGYLFIAPAFLFMAAVIVLPLVKAFWTSLQRVRGLNVSFVGFDNYARVLGDESFWNSLSVSLRFTILCVAMHMAIGLAIALLLNQVTRAQAILRIAFLTPWMVAPAICATIWLWLLEPQFGVVNYLLMAIGLIDAPKAWLGEPALAFGSIVAVDVWRGIPFVMLLLLAGLQTIPVEQYEAASIDGATPLQKFRHITLPNLRYFIVVASTLDIINTIRMFDIIAVMTGGGPVGATEVLPALLYNTAFRANQFGQAAAIGVLLLALVLFFSVFYIRLTKTQAQDASQ